MRISDIGTTIGRIATTAPAAGTFGLSGVAALVFGLAMATDCARFATKAGACRGQFIESAGLIALGLSTIGGSMAGFREGYNTYNPTLRTPNGRRRRRGPNGRFLPGDEQ